MRDSVKYVKVFFWILIISLPLISFISCKSSSLQTVTKKGENLPNITNYPIVSTQQTKFYNNTIEIPATKIDEKFYGQNANYSNSKTNYVDNGDGTITDMVTGLMWQKSPDTNGDGKITSKDKKTFKQAVNGASSFNLGGYTDWRLPTIKEQYSLIVFSGADVSGYEGKADESLIPFIDTNYFDFAYGDPTDRAAHERIIDSQYASSTKYVDYTMNGDATVFGVNFADGRIKGYGLKMPFGDEDKTFFVSYVRGNKNYGINNFVDNKNGTISDTATGLMWMQDDNGESLNWAEALSYAEAKEFANYTDWRLPNIKELQSIVDYTRSPNTTNSAAINPLFNCSKITNEANQVDYPFYWSSTTHSNFTNKPGEAAAYISFGRAMGKMNGDWLDAHGAGAQRSDPKAGDSTEFKDGRGPQGDAIRINNYVRLVRTIK